MLPKAMCFLALDTHHFCGGENLLEMRRLGRPPSRAR
jgi:uncharacterized protein YbaP (TraB family)